MEIAVDQHVIRRNRQFDLVEIIEQRPELLGIGLDENTAIVVRGDTFEVLGQGYVLIHDANASVEAGPAGADGGGGKGGSFYFMAPGDRFNMLTREATRPSHRSQGRPIEGIKKEE